MSILNLGLQAVRLVLKGMSDDVGKVIHKCKKLSDLRQHTKKKLAFKTVCDSIPAVKMILSQRLQLEQKQFSVFFQVNPLSATGD